MTVTSINKKYADFENVLSDIGAELMRSGYDLTQLIKAYQHPHMDKTTTTSTELWSDSGNDAQVLGRPSADVTSEVYRYERRSWLGRLLSYTVEERRALNQKYLILRYLTLAGKFKNSPSGSEWLNQLIGYTATTAITPADVVPAGTLPRPDQMAKALTFVREKTAVIRLLNRYPGAIAFSNNTILGVAVEGPAGVRQRVMRYLSSSWYMRFWQRLRSNIATQAFLLTAYDRAQRVLPSEDVVAKIKTAGEERLKKLERDAAKQPLPQMKQQVEIEKGALKHRYQQLKVFATALSSNLPDGDALSGEPLAKLTREYHYQVSCLEAWQKTQEELNAPLCLNVGQNAPDAHGNKPATPIALPQLVISLNGGESDQPANADNVYRLIYPQLTQKQRIRDAKIAQINPIMLKDPLWNMTYTTAGNTQAVDIWSYMQSTLKSAPIPGLDVARCPEAYSWLTSKVACHSGENLLTSLSARYPGLDALLTSFTARTGWCTLSVLEQYKVAGMIFSWHHDGLTAARPVASSTFASNMLCLEVLTVVGDYYHTLQRGVAHLNNILKKPMPQYCNGDKAVWLKEIVRHPDIVAITKVLKEKHDAIQTLCGPSHKKDRLQKLMGVISSESGKSVTPNSRAREHVNNVLDGLSGDVRKRFSNWQKYFNIDALDVGTTLRTDVLAADDQTNATPIGPEDYNPLLTQLGVQYKEITTNVQDAIRRHSANKASPQNSVTQTNSNSSDNDAAIAPAASAKTVAKDAKVVNGSPVKSKSSASSGSFRSAQPHTLAHLLIASGMKRGSANRGLTSGVPAQSGIAAASSAFTTPTPTGITAKAQ